MSDQKFYKGLYKNKKDALKASFGFSRLAV